MAMNPLGGAMRIPIVCCVGTALVVVLAGCPNNVDGQQGSSYPEPSTYPVTSRFRAPIFEVPSWQCPANYGVGLTITTDSEAEVEYLDDIVACTNEVGSATYLKNNSDAVWSLRNLGSVPATAFSWGETLTASSFRSVFGPEQVLMVPQAVLTANVPPQALRWDIDLPLSVSWEGHGVVVEQIASAGEAAVLDALRRRSPAGAAIVTCTLAVKEYASSVGGLEDADLSEVVLAGLGSGIATNRCRQAASLVPVVEKSTGRTVAMSTEIDHLARQTAVLQRVETRLSYAARAGRILKLGIRFFR